MSEPVVVHVLGSMAAGGNERLCLELIRRAPPGSRQVLLTIDPQPEGPLADLFRAIPGLAFIHEPYARDARIRFVTRLALHLRKLKPRGVIVYPFGLHVLVALASKAVPGCRIISHAGNPPPDNPRHAGVYRLIVLASRLLGAPIWCCSEAVYQRFTTLGAMPRHSRAQPNGIDIVTLHDRAAHGRSTRTEQGPVLGMVARLEALKDHDTLLAAFALAREQLPTARLWIVGEGERRLALERLVAAQGTTAAVSFLGVRRDVGELLGKLDLFVFSTTAAEGFGIALAEAMAVGLPIIASDVPACREVLANGSCGELVPAGDARAMADAILNLLGHPTHAQALAQAAEARARSAYDIKVCADNYYRYLLAPH